jgi:thiol-disulfide isomerase/thioredoxin
MAKEINYDRRRFLGAAAMTIVAAQLGIVSCKAAQLAIEGDMPSLGGATEWLNSRQLTRADLSGKVVLIDFWTYSCINWRRTLPYIRAWAGKYKEQGLEVIGVHAPEFAFEKNVDNVRWATKHMNIDYPIAIDNDRAIWVLPRIW